MKRIFQGFAAAFLTAAISTTAFATYTAPSPATVAHDKKVFINELVTKDHFNRQKITALLRSLHPNEKIIKTMTAPFEKQPWTYYHNFFLTPKRIALGVEYMKTHHHELMQMQEKYGIPPSIITAIIGVETEYGLHLGKYSVLDALYTLGFYYPQREKFFRSELAQYLILTRDNHLSIYGIKGSYAGALGIPQFMPSSYRRFGVSASGQARVDLFHQDDAIASVGNYFNKMGWQPNQPVTHKLWSRFSHDPHSVARITLPVRDGTQYWAAFPNFKVIMRYNNNIVYAMAVYQLSQALQKKYDQSSVS